MRPLVEAAAVCTFPLRVQGARLLGLASPRPPQSSCRRATKTADRSVTHLGRVCPRLT